MFLDNYLNSGTYTRHHMCKYVVVYTCAGCSSCLSAVPVFVKVTTRSFETRGSQAPRHDASSGCGWKNGLQYGGWLRIYEISSRGQPIRVGPRAWGLGGVLTAPHLKKILRSVHNCVGLTGGGLL